MINEETRRKLNELNLSELISYLEMQHIEAHSNSLTFDERLQMMIDYLYQEKFVAKFHRLLKSARLRIPSADIGDVLYAPRGVEKQMILELATCQYIKTNTNIILQGFTGSGKTYLGCVLGKQACKMQFRTRYIRMPDLLMEYDESTLITGGPHKLLKKYSGIPLLIIDEWLMDEISDLEQHFLFELIERRYDSGSTIFCTQFRKEDWHNKLGGGVHADAIMDRIIHNAVFIETGIINMREIASGKKILDLTGL